MEYIEPCLFTPCFVPALHLEDFHTRLEFREEGFVPGLHLEDFHTRLEFREGEAEALKPIRLKHVALLTCNYPILWLFQHRCSWCSCCMCHSSILGAFWMSFVYTWNYPRLQEWSQETTAATAGTSSAGGAASWIPGCDMGHVLVLEGQCIFSTSHQKYVDFDRNELPEGPGSLQIVDAHTWNAMSLFAGFLQAQELSKLLKLLQLVQHLALPLPGSPDLKPSMW